MGNDVLILDEVTSNMDGRSERLFYQALLKLRGRAVGPATFYLHYGTTGGGFSLMEGRAAHKRCPSP